MNKIHLVLMLVVFGLVGCGPKCIPESKYVVDFPHDQELPFRISGVTTEVEQGSPMDDDDYILSLKGLLAVRKISETSLLSSKLVNEDSDRVVNVRIILHELWRGRASIWGQTPSRYAAKYQVVNPESGEVLFEKRYLREHDFVRESDMTCLSMPEATAVLYQAINEVNSEFLTDLYTVEPRTIKVSGHRLGGSLGVVRAIIPVTRDNLEWLWENSGTWAIDTNWCRARFHNDLSTQVSKAIQAEKVFDHSSENVFDVTIFVPKLDKRSNFLADAVIYRNGVEVGSVEWGRDDWPDDWDRQIAFDQYTVKIVEALKKLK